MNKKYYEVHFSLPNIYDTQIRDTFRGKAMRSRSAALKCVDLVKKQYPRAFCIDIALYDGDGRID